MMSLLMQEIAMRTTLTIDDQLFAKALGLAEPGIEKSELIRECVKAFIQRQTARRLAALGGLAPDIDLAPRRREEEANS
jgi:Arc/MetJ family transcription regulator